VSTSANYLPPTVTPAQVGARADVPVFYAVGHDDINAERMRAAVVVLRSSGASVTVPTLNIGHVLDPDVIHRAAVWFGDVCADRLAAHLDELERVLSPEAPAVATAGLEAILAQAAWHDAATVERARQLYGQAVAPGEQELQRIRERLSRWRDLATLDRVTRLEQRYGGTTWSRRVTELRRELERDPSIAAAQAERRHIRRQEEARRLWNGIERLVTMQRFDEAHARCRVLIAEYADLPEAEQARQLDERLKWRMN
jgi:hypothetical protein